MSGFYGLLAIKADSCDALWTGKCIVNGEMPQKNGTGTKKA